MKVETDRVLAIQGGTRSGASRTCWPPTLLGIAAALVAIVVAYWSTAASMVGIWNSSETYVHGYLIAPIAAVLIWRKRHVLAGIAPHPDWLGFVFLAGAGFAWLVAMAGQVQVVQQYALTAMVPAAVIALAGRHAARAIAFPLAFLLLAVPFGEAFLPQLMDWTADFTVTALRVTGIPVYREGTFFAVPSGRWSVVEACSGLRYLIASITVGALFAYINYQRWGKRVAFMALSVLVPIVANFFRAYMIVMIGHLSDMKLAVGVDHFIYGWVFFGAVIGLLFWLGSYWRDPVPSPVADAATSHAPGSMAGVVAATLGVGVLLAAWPVYAARLEASDTTAVTLQTPAAMAGWSLADNSGTDWRPRYSGAAASVFQLYRKGDQTVALYVGLYRSQRQGAELVNSQNTVHAPPRWMSVGSTLRTESFGERPHEVRETRLLASGARLVAWEWFRINETGLVSPFAAKVLLARDKLLGRGDASAVIILAASYDNRPDEAVEILRQFGREMSPSLEAALGSVHQGNAK